MRSCVPVAAAANEESIFARAKGHRRRRQLGRRGIGERIVCRRASQMRRVPRRREGESKRGPDFGYGLGRRRKKGTRLRLAKAPVVPHGARSNRAAAAAAAMGLCGRRSARI